MFLGSEGLVAVDASTGCVVGTGETADSFTYGDLEYDNGEVLAVRERESGDQLVALDRVRGEHGTLHTTDGFLASPRALGTRIAWSQWAGDVMPWDSSEVWIGHRPNRGRIQQAQRVAGSPEESALQPTWGPDGTLYFISDGSGWWNLYRWRDGHVDAVAPVAAECATAPWESTYSNYVLLPRDRIALTVQSGPEQRLVLVESDLTSRVVDLPYTTIKPYLAPLGDRVGLIGASPTREPEIALVATDGSNTLDVIRRSSARPEPARVSVPEVLRVAAGDATATVLFYPPLEDSKQPPLIVRPHAGPTYNSELRLNPEVQFFTSRGFAVAEVDYRGSTGYGRSFRKALDGGWGHVDVEDCCNVALHLIEAGRVHTSAVFISGSSAGGYTALKAVCDDGPFALAVARSAIIDPQRWRTTAPRFQRPHATILASATSPVRADEVRRGVLLIHGVADDVAPVSDVRRLAAAVQDHGLLVDLLEFDGVGHYLSAAARRSAVEAELAAYQAVLSRMRSATPAPGVA
ncbi:peptidase [Asanoa ferruginea]|nr:peptidase [Asanoa ferruginea]